MSTAAHPWITELRTRLDALEAALLRGDATKVESASAQVQAVLQHAPKTAEFGQAGGTLRADMLDQAQRFGQLRQAVMRANGHNERALRSLMPGQAKQATYGRLSGATKPSGPGQAFLSA
jgi:hypothetical protein